MKKVKVVIVCIIAIMGFGAQSFGQMDENQFSNSLPVVTDDNSFVVDNFYLGTLNSVNFSTEKLDEISTYSVRLGAMAHWDITKDITVKSYGAYDRSNGVDCVIGSFSLFLQSKNKKFNLEFGRMATPATEIRPLPPTADGHFETWTEALMPGGAIGAKIGYNTDFGSIKIGVASRKNPEYSFHLNTQIKGSPFNLVGVLGGEKKDNYLVGLTHKVGKLYQVAVFKQQYNFETLSSEQVVGYFGNYELSVKMKLNVYLDAGYNLNTQDIPRLEGGLIKNFSSKHLGGLLALGYSHEIKAIKGYIFIYIHKKNIKNIKR